MEPFFVGDRIMDCRKLNIALTAAAALMLVAGCSRTDNEPGPGGVTVSEAKALNDAAEMLESRDTASAADDDAATNENEKADK
jgi:hypothetical protein